MVDFRHGPNTNAKKQSREPVGPRGPATNQLTTRSANLINLHGWLKVYLRGSGALDGRVIALVAG